MELTRKEEMAKYFEESQNDTTGHEGEVDSPEEQNEEVSEQVETEGDVTTEEVEDSVADDIESTDSGSEETDSFSEEYKINPPASWTKAEKEYFNSIPDEIITDGDKEYDLGEMKRLVAEYSKNLQSGYDKKFQDNADALKEYEAISGAFTGDYSAWLNQNGISKAQATAMLAQTHRSLLTDPVGTVKNLMNQFGIKPNQVGAASDEDFEDDWNPNSREIDELKSKISQLERQGMSSQQAQAQAQIDNFLNASDTDGNLIHKHYDNVVESEMLVLLQTNQAKTLEEAYAKSPTVIQRSFNEDREKKAKEQAEAKRRKVAEAKKASKSVSNKTSVASTKKLSRREELELAFNNS